MDTTNLFKKEENLNTLATKNINFNNHIHNFIDKGNYVICVICRKRKLKLEKSSQEDLLIGYRDDGKKYSVRRHRKHFLLPADWIKFYNSLKGRKAKLTAFILVNTGARINEIRFIEERDLDYQRNTLRLRITKTKARKKGEERGTPRTIPVSSKFTRIMRKVFKGIPQGHSLGANVDKKNYVLSTPAFNISMKKALKTAGIDDYFMFSSHNIRKTHGNWLKILGNLRIMNIDASEICLRLGHDYNTFLKDYGSSSVMDNKDVGLALQVLDDLYRDKSRI